VENRARKIMSDDNKNIIVVDITVANCQIRALKPKDEYQTMPMPNTDTEKLVWWNSVDPGRINNRLYGTLKGQALKKAEKLVNENGGINIPGEYGSLEIDEKDFEAAQ
jgi:hypothetical protein